MGDAGPDFRFRSAGKKQTGKPGAAGGRRGETMKKARRETCSPPSGVLLEAGDSNRPAIPAIRTGPVKILVGFYPRHGGGPFDGAHSCRPGSRAREVWGTAVRWSEDVPGRRQQSTHAPSRQRRPRVAITLMDGRQPVAGPYNSEPVPVKTGRSARLRILRHLARCSSRTTVIGFLFFLIEFAGSRTVRSWWAFARRQARGKGLFLRPMRRGQRRTASARIVPKK